MLCSLADIKAVLGATGTDAARDALLTQYILRAGRAMCGAEGAGRLLEQTALEHRFDIEPGQTTLWLPVWPLVAVTSVREADYGAWASAADLVEGTDWWADYAAGRIDRIGFWVLPGRQTVRCQYVGGYWIGATAPYWSSASNYALAAQVNYQGAIYQCILAVTLVPPAVGVAPSGDATHWVAVPNTGSLWLDSANYALGEQVSYQGAIYQCVAAVTLAPPALGTAPPADATHWSLVANAVPLPDDLRGACVRQTVDFYLHRTEPGIAAHGVGGANVTLRDVPGVLLPEVAAVCQTYRRIGGAW